MRLLLMSCLVLVACETRRPRRADPPPRNHAPPARIEPSKPARHSSHEHPHGGHPHARQAHHHHPHPHPHLDGDHNHHHPF